jgi:hypothetical protein
MTDTRTRVDELIEESYLVSLPEDAIRKDVHQFLAACGHVVSQSPDDEKRQEMLRRLTMFEQLGQRLESAEELSEEADQWSAWSPHDLLAHRAARLKLLVRDALGAVDEQTANRIVAERFPRPLPTDERAKLAPHRAKTLVFRRRRRFLDRVGVWSVRVLYVLLFVALLAVAGYRFYH